MWIVLLDHSGSMGDPFTGKQTFAGHSKASTATIKLDAAKNALLDQLVNFGIPNNIALIEFTSTASVIFEGLSNDFETIQHVLESLSPEDSTDIAASLDKTTEYIASIKHEPIIRVLVISDGLSDCQPAEAAAQRLATYGIAIDLILIDPTEEGECVGRAIAIYGTVTRVTSEQQLLDAVAIAKELELRQAEEINTVARAYEAEKAAITGAVPSEERLSFTAGYPGIVSPSVWNSLLVYLYIARLKKIVEEKLQQRTVSLGFSPSTSMTQATSSIQRETLLKFVPRLEGFAFNPSSQEVVWLEDYQEINFRLKADVDTAGRTHLGSVDVYSGSLLIALLPLAISVHGDSGAESAEPAIKSAQIFNSIFASYSHKDSAIVQACAAVYRALGISMFIDKDSLRSGDKWKRVLFEFINQSDVFQLYWSDSAKESPYVQGEWKHALAIRDVKDEQFIRPLYWEEPLPQPPAELSPIHFAKLDLDALSSQFGYHIDATRQEPQHQTLSNQPIHLNIYAPVLPTLPGTSKKITAQVRNDLAFAVPFLEETSGLRYYPATTLLVDNYAVKSIRVSTTVDVPPEQEKQKRLALALTDILQSMCLDFHTSSFRSDAIAKVEFPDLFGRGQILTESQFARISYYCEYAIRPWIENYFDSPWIRSQAILRMQFSSIGSKFSDYVLNLLDFFINMIHEKKKKHPFERVNIRTNLNTPFFPSRELEQAGLTVVKKESIDKWTELNGTNQAFIQGLERLRMDLSQLLPAYNHYDYTQAKHPDDNGERCFIIGNIVGAICHSLIANQSGDFVFSNSISVGRNEFTNAQGSLLIEQSSNFDTWIQEAIHPAWRQIREELLALNMAEFSSNLNFEAFVTTFLNSVHRLLQYGLEQLGSFWHESVYSIKESSWQLLQQAIPDFQLFPKPGNRYRGNTINLSGEFSEFVRIFDFTSKRLADILHQHLHFSSSTQRFFATEVPTYGIYAPPHSPTFDETLRQWALKHSILTQLTLPQSPRVLLSLDAQTRFEEQLKKEGYSNQEQIELSALFQRCVLIHEHFHAILEMGLDHRYATATGAQFTDAWRAALPLNESLAVWMELHFARGKPDLMDLVMSYIYAGSYPEWPYRGAEYIEHIYQEQGIDAIRKLISDLRQDPKTAQAQFDAIRE